MEKKTPMGRIDIPHKENHPYVGDNLTRYYHIPFIRYFFLRRLTLALDFIGKMRFNSLLEIGFGSGILLRELSKRSRHVFGVDKHEHISKVDAMAKIEGINARLIQSDIMCLPYKDESFDCIVSIATLEHIKELPKAISEVKRVLKKNGLAVLGFPVANLVSDFLLVLTGSLQAYKKELKEIHPSTHQNILLEVKRQFGNIEVKSFPKCLPLDFSLYCSCASRKSG